MSYEQSIIDHARALQRHLTQRRKLRRQLKACEAAVKHERKMLKAVQASSEQRRPDVMPSRLTNGATGYVDKL